MTSQHFPYRLDKRWAALFFALGVGDDDGVDISDDDDALSESGFQSTREIERTSAYNRQRARFEIRNPAPSS
jgi:hypothetical protein